MTRGESNTCLNIEMDDVMSELNIQTSLLITKFKDQRRYSKFGF